MTRTGTASFQFGATHAVATIEKAAELARGFTNGQGADQGYEDMRNGRNIRGIIVYD